VNGDRLMRGYQVDQDHGKQHIAVREPRAYQMTPGSFCGDACPDKQEEEREEAENGVVHGCDVMVNSSRFRKKLATSLARIKGDRWVERISLGRAKLVSAPDMPNL